MDYTKGEWKTSDSGFARYSTFGRTVNGARKFVVNGSIGIIAEAQGETQEEAEANANLIASAPKQNEALIWVAEWLGIRKPDGGKPNRADVIRIVKEALAKAKPE